MTSQTSADSSSDNHDPRLLWPSPTKQYCGILRITLSCAHVSIPSDESTRDSLGLLQEDSEWKIYAVVDCGMHQRSSAATNWRRDQFQKQRVRVLKLKPGADAEDTIVFWERPEAFLHYWVREDSPKITVHIIAQNHGTETNVLLCSFRTEPKQLDTQASLHVDSHHGQGSLSLELFSPQEFLPLSERLSTLIPGKYSPGKVVYVRHGDGLRCALVAVRSTAESPLRTDLLDATHGTAPFISPVISVYQAERTLFYLLTVIPGGGNLFVHLQRERRFTEARVRKYGAQLICALKWLHSNNTVACLRPETVMLDCFDHICLCASTAFILGADATLVGCLAPELSEGLPRTKMTDWWDLGILLYEMLTGLPPLLSCSGQGGRKKKGGDDLSFPGYLSASAKEVLGMLLHSDPEKRLGARGAQEILSSSFFQSIARQECANRDTNVFRSSSDDDVLALEPRADGRPLRFPERRTSQGVVYEKEYMGPISFWRSFGVMMSEEARAIYSSPTPPDTAWHIVWDDIVADFRFSNSVTGKALLSSEQAKLCGLEQLESILSGWNLRLSELGASCESCVRRYAYSPNRHWSKSCAPFQLTRALAVALKMQCSAEMVCQILDRGADLNTIVLMWQETYDTYLMPMPHVREDIPVAPLEWAIEHQRMDLVDLFLERGADINFVGYPQHGPALVTAALRRNLALVRRLVGRTERCAATRALCLAVEQEDLPMVEALLASSVRCEYEDPKWPQRPDYYGRIFGPDPRLDTDSDFTPPLARAVRLGNMELVHLLLAHGADPNVAYHNICRGHPRQARELHLPPPQYSCGRPVYLAAELKFDEIVEVLIRGGADIHLKHPRAVEVQGVFEDYMPHKCSVVARSVHLDVFSRLEAELSRIKKNNLER